MLKTIGRALAIFVVVSASGCSPKPVSFELLRDGESILACDSAMVSELNPVPGGWTMQCSAGTLNVVYETGESKARGTIKYVWVQPADGERIDFTAAYEAPDAECEKAPAAAVGPSPLDAGMSGVKPGTYEIPMAAPCAVLELKVGAAD